MPFSHHSHSGQFCGHAKNTLAEVLATAQKKNMSVFAVTEHIPRGDDFLYPEEIEVGTNEEKLKQLFHDYVAEAVRLRDELQASQRAEGGARGLQVLIGFETEWIREEESAQMVAELRGKYSFDFFVGSIHHVHTIPIDMDRARYEGAKEACGGTEEALFAAYFDAQFEMLRAFQPKVVGHFDLIRLLGDQPDVDWSAHWGGEVWKRIMRNLRCVRDYGGLLEINSSALRKGMAEPYPRSEICQAFAEMGGDFVMSDDSHGVEQIGTNYARVLKFMRSIGLERVAYLEREEGKGIVVKTLSMTELEQHAFWTTP